MFFALPQMLWLLLVVPPGLLVFFVWAWRKREELMRGFIAARLLPGLLSGTSAARRRAGLALLIGASTFGILALARPQWGFTWQDVKQRGVDIVVAIDCSKSMLAQDIAPNRLARAKLAALELMQKARSDRLGVVAFAGAAFLACPLTIDDSAFAQSVESLDINTVSQGGTALAEAIETAATAFKEGDAYKVLVLMTDGEDHEPGAKEAAEKAAQAGLRIFTIGIGTADGELVRIKDPQGNMDYVRDENGNVVKSHLDERLLSDIASATPGGFYLPLRGAKTIDTLYERGLATLPKSEHQEKFVKQYHDRFQWPLSVAILLLVVETLLPVRARSSGRRVAAPAAAKSALAVVALLLLADAPAGFCASPAKALREYKQGQYDQALKDYEKLLERNSDDPRLRFNAGTAAYRNRKFDEAAKQFGGAAASPDLGLQESAYYNRGNSLFRLGEASQDPQQRMQNWEKSLKDFESSMKLNPNDADARFNHDVVKRRLEELKQQQQQQQQNKSNQQKPDHQQQNQSQQGGQSGQQQEQQQQQQQQQQQAEQNEPNSSKPQQQPGQQQQEQQAANQQPQHSPDKPEGEKQQASAQPASEGQKGDNQTEAGIPGQMTPEQARQLLDAQKGDEKMLSPMQQKPAGRTRPIKDW